MWAPICTPPLLPTSGIPAPRTPGGHSACSATLLPTRGLAGPGSRLAYRPRSPEIIGQNRETQLPVGHVFAPAVLGQFVGADSLERGSAQPAVRGPALVLHLADQLRPQPVRTAQARVGADLHQRELLLALPQVREQ